MTDTAWANLASDQAAKGAGLERGRAIWHRRKWLLIVAFALPFAAAASLVGALPKVYKSTVVVLVERQQVPEDFVKATVTSEIETRLQMITQEILSRSRLEALINRFNLYPDLAKQVSGEEVVERMRGAIHLELKSADQRRGATTVAFALSYQGGDPRAVAQVANTIASFYIEENLKSRERQAAGTAEFLRGQLEEAKRRLDGQERKVSAFRTRYMGELPQQMQSNLTSVETLSAQLRLNSDNQLRANERREALTSQLAEAATLAQVVPLPVAGAGVAAPEPPAVRLARLRQDVSAATARFTDAHPTVIRLRAELAAAETEQAQVKAELPSDGNRPGGQAAGGPPSLYVLRLRESLQGAGAELKVLKAEEQQLRAALAAYRTRVENTPRREQELLDLSRDYDTTKAHYQSLVKRYEDAQLAESMEQRQKGEQFRVVEPAIASAIAAAPNRPRLLALSFALSAGLAVGLTLLAEVLDTSFHSADDLRALGGAPILARIPWIVTEADARRRRHRFRLAAAATLLALVAVASAFYVVGHGNERLVYLISRGA